MPVYIADRWIPYLDMLPNKDFCILVKAILHHEDEPTISPKFQAIAHNIYEDMRELARAREGMKKTRSDRNCYSNCYGNSYVTVTQEEKKEVSPLSSPLSSPPHPLISPPYNPPSPEKREESVSDAGARAIVGAADKPGSLESRFEALWKLYPKKAGKTNAFNDYKRAVKDGVTDEEIADGIRRYTEHIKARNTEPQYILQGSTYFHQRRWTDEYCTPSYQQTAPERSGDVFLDYLNEQLQAEQRKESWQ